MTAAIHCFSAIASHYLWGRIHLDVPEELLQEMDSGFKPRSFWLYDLPKTFLWDLITAPLNYRWQCWLEWLLPARRRGPAVYSQPRTHPEKEVVDIETDDEMEERVMRKLIAKGKVQRSGFSWFNTIAKWILDISFMNLVWIVLGCFWDVAWHSEVRSMPLKELKIVRASFSRFS